MRLSKAKRGSKRKWDKYASKSVSSLKNQRREKLGSRKRDEPWQRGLPHYGVSSGKGK